MNKVRCIFKSQELWHKKKGNPERWCDRKFGAVGVRVRGGAREDGIIRRAQGALFHLNSSPFGRCQVDFFLLLVLARLHEKASQQTSDGTACFK
jgi:hypothetical protein